jgi:Uma2 family endonuclease
MATVPKPFVTPAEYLRRERKAEFRSEYYQGEMFAMACASANHNWIVLNAGATLREQLKSKPCRVYPSDLRLRVSAVGLYSYPDLSVVSGEPQLESDGGDVLLNPILVVEVLSESTEAYDRGKKFGHYRTIQGLQHYVSIAQDRYAMDCFTPCSDGTWSLYSCQTLEGKSELKAIDCLLKTADVYDKVTFPS